MSNTDKKLRALEAWLSNLYKDAENEMRGKWDEYLQQHEKTVDKLLTRVREAKDDEAKKKATKAYLDYMKDHIQNTKYYQGMVRELASQYADVNSRALRMVNGKRAEFFADGYNFSADEINAVAIRQDIGIRFDLCDADTVEWLAERRNDLILPAPKYLEWDKDMLWNVKNMNAQMAQGIVQGESIPKIAKRIENVTNMNTVSAVRAARTMATACENAGRVQAMERAESWGVHTKKRWMSTHDSRTRDSHLKSVAEGGVDGETVEEDAYFSNGCRYPGDPIGPASETYNCRCTLITVVDGFSSTLPKGKENAVHVWVDGEQVR